MGETRIDYHRDAVLFRSALGFTAAQTGFSERLIEKDYFCSVALADLCASDDTEIVFKGGTCLSKVHADFFRLSEDLDFSLSTPIDVSAAKLARLRAQVDTDLRPVIREADFQRFDVDRAFQRVADLAAILNG